jgi:hypothetical protein
VTRGWDVQSEEQLVPQSAKPTPRMPLSRPPAAAGGAVTRGWDVQSGEDLGPPGKAPAAAASAPGGVTRGWDVPADDEVELGLVGARRAAGPAGQRAARGRR